MKTSLFWDTVIIVIFVWQMIITIIAERAAQATGNYGEATYELVWLLLIVLIGDNNFRNKKKDGS